MESIMENAVVDQQNEIEKRNHIIKAMEEINVETVKKKRKLRKGGPGDNVRAATDLMHELAGGSGKDDSSTGD
jgi:hypothetical protein